MVVSQNDIKVYLYNVRRAFVDYGTNVSKYQRLGRKEIQCSKVSFRLLQYLLRIVVDYFDSDDYENVNFFTLSEIRDIMQHINNICGTNFMLDMTPAEDEWTIRGKSYGSSSTSARLKAYGELIGECSGLATVSGSIYTGVTEIYGISNGVATTSGSIWGYAYIAGISNGSATTEGTIFGDPPGIYPIAGISNGVATVNGSIGNAVGVPQSYNLHGFGTDSLFAYAGVADPKIMVVDRLTTSSTDGAVYGVDGIDYKGSFEYCLKQTFPRIILFETSGTIDYNGSGKHGIYVKASDGYTGYCWVVGQSAPSPGIDIIGAEIRPEELTDVLMTHITTGFGDQNDTVYASDLDSFSLTDCENFVMDHLTIRWGTDEVTSNSGSNVTLSHCFTYEGLGFHLKSHKEGSQHAFTSMSTANNITWYKNLIAMNTNRNPWVDSRYVSGSVQNGNLINNYHYNTWIRLGGELGKAAEEGGKESQIDVIGNVAYRMNDNYTSYIQDYGVMIAWHINNSSKFYINDLLCKRKDDGYTDWQSVYVDTYTGSNEVSPLHSILDYNILNSSAVKTEVLNNSGSKFRDAHDLRVINDVDLETDRQTSIHPDYTGLMDSPAGTPARAVNWGNAAGDVSGGCSWSGDNQSFTINVNGGGNKNVTLNAYCVDRDTVVDHINTQMTSAGVSGAEAYKITYFWAYSTRHVGIRTTSIGSTQEIVITNSTVTKIDLQNGTYNGTDSVSGGYLTRAVNNTTHTIPANPHDIHPESPLTNLEVWILEEFGAIGDGYNLGTGGQGNQLLANSGLSGMTDWVDGNSDGLADSWNIYSSDSFTASIITGNGFTGNAQRVVYDGTSGECQLYYDLGTQSSGTHMDIVLKYRSNVGIAINFEGYDEILTAGPNIGNASEVSDSVTLTGNRTYFRIYIDDDETCVDGDWIEVDEVSLIAT